MDSNPYHQIMNSRGPFARLLDKLPGFEGYADRNARRAADRMLREHLAGLVDRQIKRLAAIERALLDKHGMALMPATSSAKTKLQTYHDRILSASQGYTGFFAASKIDSEELDLLYGFDELQIVQVEKLDAALDAVETAVTSGTGIDEAIAALDAQTREANDAFLKRDNTLRNLK